MSCVNAVCVTIIACEVLIPPSNEVQHYDVTKPLHWTLTNRVVLTVRVHDVGICFDLFMTFYQFLHFYEFYFNFMMEIGATQSDSCEIVAHLWALSNVFLNFFLYTQKDWYSLSLLMLPHVNNDVFMVLKPFP